MRRLVTAGVVCAWVALSVTGLAQSGQKTDPQLTKLAKQWEASFNARDAAKVAALYAEDASVYPPNQTALRGRAAIQKWVEESLGIYTSMTITPTESAIAGDVAYEAGTYAGKMASGSDKGKYIVVLKRIGGQWLIVHDIFNSDLPASPPSQ